MSSRIEQAIDEIEDFIENCKYQPLSNTKIVVNKDELGDLLAELRRRTPDEIKRYQKMISNKEAILADAKAKADAIISQAEAKTKNLVNEHEIMMQAYAQANEVVMIARDQAQEILDNAANDAHEIRMGAIQYTDNMLANIEEIIANAMETSRARTENLLNSLQGCYEEIDINRRGLPTDYDEAAPTQKEEAAPEESMLHNIDNQY